MKKNIAIIGIGPHAKRIYLHYIKKHKENLCLVIELESEKNITRKYLDENGFKNTKIFCISNKYKDNYDLPKEVESNLKTVMNLFEISHIMISTEPKAHNMYLKFALKNNINVLTDKPITVTKNMTNLKNIKLVKKQYYELLKLSEKSTADCKVMCQRQYHKGYQYIKNLLNDIIKEYQIPITHIDIYHSDGNWEMMHDLDKENHPYKYGYGKLFHSGYHFIDLISDILKINNNLPSSKKIKNAELYSNCMTPNDEKAIFTIDDYKRIFKNQQIPNYYNEVKKPNFNKYGEKNFYGLMKFTNSNKQLITEVSMNLLHYGYSRRGWIQSKDFYKANGRIRHERININVGPLLNIQVHSYQSKEIKDRTLNVDEQEVGGLEHFEIHIYRNIDIIGGEPFTKINLEDLYTEKEKKNILGFNELSREHYIKNFLNGKCDRGDIKDQALAIEILTSCAKGLHNHYKNKNKIETISLKSNYIYPNTIEEFRKYSFSQNYEKLEKKLISLPITIIPKSKYDNSNMIKENVKYLKSIFNKFIDDLITFDYVYNITFNRLINSNNFEVFVTVVKNDEYASSILYKQFKYKVSAKIYINVLKLFMKNISVNSFLKLVEYDFKFSKKICRLRID